jgi:hypothetical protein
MSAARNGRAQQQPATPPANGYVPLLPGLASCARCAALIVDGKASRETHDNHHRALRALWEQTGGQR